MILPGKVVVLDDQYTEVKDLISVLTKDGVPLLYFDGSLQGLPANPLSDVSSIFLDINLIQGQNDERVVESTLRGVLKRIISIKNVPFIVFIWSKIATSQKEIVERIFNGDDAISTRPIAIVEMKKDEIFDADGTLKIDNDKVSAFLETKLLEHSGNDVYKYFQAWSAALNESYNKVVCELFSVEGSGDWQQKVKKVIVDLAVANYGGKASKVSNSEKIINSKVLLGEAITDEMSTVLNSLSQGSFPSDLPQSGSALGSKLSNLVNKSLLIGEGAPVKNFPGNLFKTLKSSSEHNSILKASIPSNLFGNGLVATDSKRYNKLKEKKRNKKITSAEKTELSGIHKQVTDHIRKSFGKLKKASIFAELVVTPMCDFAQGKNKSIFILPIVLIEVGDESGLVKSKVKTICNGEQYYDTNAIFEFKGKNYVFSIDYSYYKAVELTYFEKKVPFLKIKQQFLFDLQYRLSNTLGRPGVVFIDYRHS